MSRPGLVPPTLVAPVLVGVLGLTGIALLHDIPVRHGIEEDLTGRSTIALNRAGLSQASVDLTGRDAVISGVTGADASRAREVVLAVRGIRAARVETGQARAVPTPGAEPNVTLTGAPTVSATSTTTVTPSAQPAPTDQPKDQLPLSLTFEGGTVTLTGWVGSQQQRDDMDAALERAGGWTVVDLLVIDPTLSGAEGPAADGLPDVTGAVPKPGDGLIVRFTGGGAEVRGTVGSAGAETAILTQVGTLVPAGGTTEDHIDVQPDAKAVKKQLADLPRITFRSGSAELTPEGRRAVAKAAAVLKAAGPLDVRVGGHTDASGSAALNLRISKRRADVVRARLVELGVRGKLTSKGYGETKPLVRERSAADAAKNRRVEFALL